MRVGERHHKSHLPLGQFRGLVVRSPIHRSYRISQVLNLLLSHHHFPLHFPMLQTQENYRQRKVLGEFPLLLKDGVKTHQLGLSL